MDIFLYILIYFVGYFLTVYYINKQGLTKHLKDQDLYYQIIYGWFFWWIIAAFIYASNMLEDIAEDLGKLHKK